MGKKYILGLISIFCLFGFSNSAFAANSSTTTQIVAALQESGYKAKLTINDGIPEIETAAAGEQVVISFSDCSSDTKCNYAEIMISLSCKNSQKACEDAVKEWQAMEKFSSAIYFPATTHLTVYHYLIVGGDGVSKSVLTDTIEYVVEDLLELDDNIAAKIKK